MSERIYTKTPENNQNLEKYEEMLAVAEASKEVVAELRERDGFGDAESADFLQETIDKIIDIDQAMKEANETGVDTSEVISEQDVEDLLGDLQFAIEAYKDSVRRIEESDQTSTA